MNKLVTPKPKVRVELVEQGTKPKLSLQDQKALRVLAKYDAAQTTHSNARHWLAADGLSPTSANSESVRKTLRERSRYEIANNSYARGMVDTMVVDIVGTGPRHQLMSGSVRSETDQEVERVFEQWKRDNLFSSKISLAKKSEISSGEVFAVLGRGQTRKTSGVSIFEQPPEVELGFHLIEADQIADPLYESDGYGEHVSGIRFDSYGNPTAYHLLNHHPGDELGETDGRWIPADLVLHLFREERPGDARGIPLITPALELFAYLRRYTLATVESAEHIANVAGVLQTDAPADGEAETLESMDTIDFERGMITVLPHGWKYGQATAEQPTATYREFVAQLLREIARSMGLPYNIAAGDSSGYNYASGRLDHQVYQKMIRVEQARLKTTILDPVFWAWFAEASRVDGILPAEARTEDYRRSLRVSWFFDGAGHVDPTKEAQAEKIRLESGTTTLMDIAAKDGQDWRDIMDQQAEEQRYREQLGLAKKPTKPDQPTDQGETEQDQTEEVEEETESAS